MIKSFVVLVLLAAAVPALAQPLQAGRDTQPSSSGKREHQGWYAAPMFRTTWMDGQGTDMVGLRAAVRLDHGLSVGVAGAAFVNAIPWPDYRPREGLARRGGYGGVLVEYLVGSSHGVHASLEAVVGAGGTCVVTRAQAAPMGCLSEAGFFMLEPGATLGIDIAPGVRLGLSAGYRFADAEWARGASLTTSLMFGQF